MIINGATSPAPLAMARIMPVRMPGNAPGSTILRIVSHLVEPNASEPSRHSRGIAANDSSVATMTTGTVIRARVSEAQNRPPVPNVAVFALRSAW